jgi:predicted protein tyrosine phosphatase
MTVCGIADLEGHCATGASHVLSILDPGHPVPAAFDGFPEHRRLELRFHDVIEPDTAGVPPSEADVAALLAFGRGMRDGAHLLVHCHAGISRSTAAMTLILAQALPDTAADDVLGEVFRIRPKTWPNLRMMEIGDRMLGRGGDLVAASHRIYRVQLEIRPHLAEFMIDSGRKREVDAAKAGMSHAPAADEP